MLGSSFESVKTTAPVTVAVGIAIVLVAGGGRLAIPATAGASTPVAAARPTVVEPDTSALAPSPPPTAAPRSTAMAASRSLTRLALAAPATPRPAPTATRPPTPHATPHMSSARRSGPSPRTAIRGSATRSSSSAATEVSSGDPRSIARSMLASRGWSSQFSCLDSLWSRESGWSTTAGNASGAYGIPQALPGSKMASAGSDWRTNAATQISWGLGYISSTWGSPCAAWSHSQSTGWY